MTHMFARKGFNPPHRILIIRPSALGDVARTVPLLVSLRDSFPAAKIDWLVQDSFVDVVRAHPALTEALPFPRAEFSRWLRAGRVDRLWSYLASLRSREYDIVIDAQGPGSQRLDRVEHARAAADWAR